MWLFCLLDPEQIQLYPPKSNSWLRPCMNYNRIGLNVQHDGRQPLYDRRQNFAAKSVLATWLGLMHTCMPDTVELIRQS